MLIALAAAAALALLALVMRIARREASAPVPAATDAGPNAEPIDAIIVGSGIAGLSAAYELGRGGARVVVIDMASIFGGHAVMATFNRGRGTVFNAGSANWCYGLGADPVVEAITRNVLARLG